MAAENEKMSGKKKTQLLHRETSTEISDGTLGKSEVIEGSGTLLY